MTLEDIEAVNRIVKDNSEVNISIGGYHNSVENNLYYHKINTHWILAHWLRKKIDVHADGYTYEE